MKKVALLFVAILFATVTFAQSNLPIDPKTEKICFRKVIPTQGTEDKVFNRIFSNFMNSYYKSPATLLNQNDGRTMKGELYPDIAPESVGNFVALANSGFYDGLIFHRVIPGFMIQGGDPKGMGYGGPGYSIRGEFAANGVSNPLKHTYGVLSMARSMNPDSAGSQFFIMTSDSPHLDGQYAAFGKVLEGMEVAEEIVNAPRDDRDRPYDPPTMKTVRVETFGEVYPFEQIN